MEVISNLVKKTTAHYGNLLHGDSFWYAGEPYMKVKDTDGNCFRDINLLSMYVSDALSSSESVEVIHNLTITLGNTGESKIK